MKRALPLALLFPLLSHAGETALRRTPAPFLEPLITAERLLESGDAVGARRLFDDVLRLSPDEPRALLGLAEAAQRSGAVDAARHQAERVLRGTPPPALFVRAIALLPAESAEHELDAALARHPDDPVLLQHRAAHFVARRDWPQALLHFERAQAARPDDPDIRFNIAVCQDRLARTLAAARHYRAAADLAARQPANFDPAQALARALWLERR